MDRLGEALGGLIIVTGMVLIVYFIAKFTFLTRKMLVEKGMLHKRTAPQINKKDIAYVTIGVGAGLLGSAMLSLLDLEENTMDLLGWGIVLIAGAAGLLIANKSNS